ncbi:hypothetical protein [Rubrivirga marina]|uniref:Phosphodiester glycosidase domain-containing protein n=1 Tax=Rubrivirga marina TaxID=1196024 RepID=A0A271IVY9_9BACT|nr:hypothetical protein [Rubrivirga marina]PAP75280.1 hypothetical protein BSZ37_01885 [Rubrivirga marina]
MRAPLAALAVALAACGGAPAPEAALPPPPALPVGLGERLAEAGLVAEPLDGADGYGLAEVRSDSGSFLGQWIDLRRVEVRQVMGEVEPGSDEPSAFHPEAPSPQFALVDPAAVVAEAEGDGAFAVLNGAFFETPGVPTSQLAFPVALGGVAVTGGSSPYGPGRPGAEGERWARPLRALGLDTLANVADYDPATGAPLGAPGFADAVVSYAPEAHPARIATRFHVLGPLDADGDGAAETLVIVTSDGRTRIGAAASVLARLGVDAGRMLALDGGASVLVRNRRAGTLHEPTSAGGRSPQWLPHYLVVAPR